MNPKRESMLLAAVQALVLVVCLGLVGWAVATGLIHNVDGLLAVMIGLSLSVVFAFTLFLHAKSEGWLAKLPRPGRKKAAAEVQTLAPAAASEKAAAGESK